MGYVSSLEGSDVFILLLFLCQVIILIIFVFAIVFDNAVVGSHRGSSCNQVGREFAELFATSKVKNRFDIISPFWYTRSVWKICNIYKFIYNHYCKDIKIKNKKSSRICYIPLKQCQCWRWYCASGFSGWASFRQITLTPWTGTMKSRLKREGFVSSTWRNCSTMFLRFGPVDSTL